MRPVIARSSALLSALPGALVCAFLVAGCGAGDVIDSQKTQIAVQYDVEEATGEQVREVRCPAEVPVDIGTRFVCEVESESGRQAEAELEITSDNGDLRMYGLSAP